jgi:hypothetical protein
MNGDVVDFAVQCNSLGQIHVKVHEVELQLTKNEARYLAGVLEAMARVVDDDLPY